MYIHINISVLFHSILLYSIVDKHNMIDVKDVPTSDYGNVPDNIKAKYPNRYWAESPFPCNEDINKKVVIYLGDVNNLKAEALVNSTNEHLTRLDFVSQMAGPCLERFVRKDLRCCPTGDVRLSPGFKSNFKYIIHAVPPKFKQKYKTAAESALFSTYFRILETMLERKISTCVIPVLKASKGNLPVEDHCHIALRLLRRILERRGHEFDKLILLMIDQTELDIYSTYFRCYFPQSQQDELFACHVLEPNMIGGANGEPVNPEREIRIKSKPGDVIDLMTGLDLSTVIGKNPFCRMRDHNGNIEQLPQAPASHRPRPSSGGRRQGGASASGGELVRYRRPTSKQYCIIL